MRVRFGDTPELSVVLALRKDLQKLTTSNELVQFCSWPRLDGLGFHSGLRFKCDRHVIFEVRIVDAVVEVRVFGPCACHKRYECPNGKMVQLGIREVQLSDPVGFQDLTEKLARSVGTGRMATQVRKEFGC